MALLNFKTLSISVPDADTPISKAQSESEAKPNSTPRLGFRRVRSKSLGTIIPVAPIYRPDINPASPQFCSPTSPIPVMASMGVSMSLVASTPTTEPEAPSAPPAKVSKSASAQLFDMVHLHFYNRLRPLCIQLVRDAPSSESAFDAQYKELSDALKLGVLYKLNTLDTEGDASLDTIRKSLTRVVKDLLLFMDDVAMEQAAVHAARG
jgi:hypothetical protein